MKIKIKQAIRVFISQILSNLFDENDPTEDIPQVDIGKPVSEAPQFGAKVIILYQQGRQHP